MEEQWKDIEGYEGLYMVSDQGRVKSLGNNRNRKEKILKQGRVKNYRKIELYKNRKRKNFLVHILVGRAFIPNPDNLPEINHKDENPSNNRVENLEWCDRKYNNNFGTRNQRSGKARINHPTRSKKVLQFSKSGKFIKEYPSIMEAYRQTGVLNGNISLCCSGKYKTTGGYIWKYA